MPTTPNWGPGAFYLERTQFGPPDTDNGVVSGTMWACAGSSEVTSQRLSVLNENQELIPINATSWSDPPVNWTLVNEEVSQVTSLNQESVVNGSFVVQSASTYTYASTSSASVETSGYGCSCSIQDFGFAQWLVDVNNRDNSFTAIDFVGSFGSVPNNFYDPTKPYNASTSNMQMVYVGEPVGISSSGYFFVDFFGEGQTITDTNKRFHTIAPTSQDDLFLRAVSETVSYGFSIIMVKMEQPEFFVSDDQINTNDQVLKTDLVANVQTNDLINATVYVLSPPLEGYYYVIEILNDDEQKIETSETPPQCEMNQYFQSTKNAMTLSLLSCEEAACNGPRVCLGDASCGTSDGSTSDGSTVFHTKKLCLLVSTVLLVFCIL